MDWRIFGADLMLRIAPSLVTALVAAVAAYIAWRSLRQKRLGDDRAAWWDRVSFGLSRVSSAEQREQLIGWEVLRVVMHDAPAEDEDLAQMIREMAAQQARDLEEAYGEDVDLSHEQEEGEDDDDPEGRAAE